MFISIAANIEETVAVVDKFKEIYPEDQNPETELTLVVPIELSADEWVSYRIARGRDSRITLIVGKINTYELLSLITHHGGVLSVSD